jgi:sugar diacid utilization regulator
MQIAENKANWVDSLLDGVEIPADLISSYLHKFQWKLDDHFCIVTFAASADLKIPIMSDLDIKQINDLFPDALLTVYEEHIVMIIRCPDKLPPHGKKIQQLEQFLKKDIMLRCGVSMVSNNFMHLRLFYAQSKFAASQCKPPLSPGICSYEDYQENHVLQTLSLAPDPRCFCHPGILSLWESGNESRRELVRCLYHYFLNGRNISATADALHVHRNTLIYRLGKAEEILNVDIKQPSPQKTFLYIISCMIVQGL